MALEKENGNYIRIVGIDLRSFSNVLVNEEMSETQEDREADNNFKPPIKDKKSLNLSNEQVNAILDIVYPQYKDAHYPTSTDV